MTTCIHAQRSCCGLPLCRKLSDELAGVRKFCAADADTFVAHRRQMDPAMRDRFDANVRVATECEYFEAAETLQP